jgi:hypothetical protein
VNPVFQASPFWSQEPFVSLWPEVSNQLMADYSLALQHPAMPAWRKPQLVYARAFSRWLKGGLAPNTTETSGAFELQRRFFAELSAGAFSSDVFPALVKLNEAFRNPTEAEAILNLRAGNRPPESAIAGAMARVRMAPRSFAELLRTPAPNRIGVVSQPIERGHFAIMHRVLGGPGYADLAPRELDTFTTEYIGFLFPLRGAIPGPVVVDLMKQAVGEIQ